MQLRAAVRAERNGIANGGAQPNLLKNTPILAVWGDNIAENPQWSKIRSVVNQYYDAVRVAGGSVDLLDLPQSGIQRNSHMIMMYKNSDQVAGKIQDWMVSKGLYQ